MIERDSTPRPGSPEPDSGRHEVLAARAAQVAALAEEEPPARGLERRGAALALALAAAAAGLALVTWSPAFEWLWRRWTDPHGYYEHGPLVPFIAGWLAWRERKRLVLAPGPAATRLGLGVVLAAVLLQVGMAALWVDSGAMVALLVAAGGAALALGGTGFARALAFPLAILALGVPAPMNFIADVSLELKQLAARLAIRGLDLVGIVAVREGSIVHLAGGDVVVEDVCSGLRSLVALVTMGVLIAGFDPGIALSRRAALVALALPIAIAANAVRVAFLCGAVHFRGPDILDTWIHEGSGYFVYAISLGLLMLARRAIVGVGPFPEPALPRARGEARLERTIASIALLLVPAATAAVVLDRKAAANAAPVARALPLQLGAWRGSELAIDPQVRDVLETDDLVSRRYDRGEGYPVFLYVTASRGNRKAAHPPEVCLSANGWLLEPQGTLDLARGVQASRLLLARGKDRQLIVYFYAAGRQLGPSYLGSQAWAAAQRFWWPEVPTALVRLSAHLKPEDAPEEALGSIRGLAEELVPALRARLEEGS